MSDVFTLRGPIKKERAPYVKHSVTRKSLAGASIGSVDLEPSIFGVAPNMAVMHQVVKAQLAAKRSGTQSTKTRKEVRGGGKKPFNQKGNWWRPSGNHSCAALPGWWYCPRTQAS